jgi:hypothetical protein
VRADATGAEQAPVVQPTGADPDGEPTIPASGDVEPQPVDADATITLQPRRRCELDADDPVHPGMLALELVNDFHHFEAGFRVMRLRPAQTLSGVRAHPPGFLFAGDRTIFLGPSTTGMWSSETRVAPGRWAVVCYKDRIPARNGFTILAVGVAGLIEVAR